MKLHEFCFTSPVRTKLSITITNFASTTILSLSLSLSLSLPPLTHTQTHTVCAAFDSQDVCTPYASSKLVNGFMYEYMHKLITVFARALQRSYPNPKSSTKLLILFRLGFILTLNFNRCWGRLPSCLNFKISKQNVVPISRIFSACYAHLPISMFWLWESAAFTKPFINVKVT